MDKRMVRVGTSRTFGQQASRARRGFRARSQGAAGAIRLLLLAGICRVQLYVRLEPDEARFALCHLTRFLDRQVMLRGLGLTGVLVQRLVVDGCVVNRFVAPENHVAHGLALSGWVYIYWTEYEVGSSSGLRVSSRLASRTAGRTIDVLTVARLVSATGSFSLHFD